VRKFITTITVATGLSLSLLGFNHASADVNQAPNTMSFSEYHDYVIEGMSRRNVEAPEATPTSAGEVGCGCTGIVWHQAWRGHDGHKRIMIAYQGNEGNSSIVLYRRYGHAWRVWTRSWFCTEGVCESFATP
jgi:hypothetical protein